MSDYKRLFIGARSNAVSEIIWNAWADNSHINNTNGVNGGAYPHASISNMWACGESPTQELVDAFEMTNGAMPVTYNDATRTSITVTPGAAELGYSRSEEHTSELQSLMRKSYAVFCLTKKKHINALVYTVHSSPLT